MTTSTALELAESHPLDEKAILAYLKLDPNKVETKATFAICDRYGLDPLLKHVVVISGNVYVTRDGLLAVAHRSGQFDGIEVLDTGETTTHFTAEVAVHRKGFSHPFRYRGRFPKAKKNMAEDYGPEMAIKTAEVAALRRAFGVALPTVEERWDDEAPATTAALDAPLTGAEAARAALIDRLNGLTDVERAAVAKEWQTSTLPKVADLNEVQLGLASDLIDSVLDGLAHAEAAADHDDKGDA